MNLEQFLAAAVFCVCLGVFAGMITSRWNTKAERQNITRREDELVVLENQQAKWLADQQAEMAADSAARRQLAEEKLAQADETLAEAKRINDETRQLLKAASEPFEADETADTVLIDPINVQTIVEAARKYL